MTATMTKTFEYNTARVKDFSVSTVEVEEKTRGRQLRKINRVNQVFIEGRPVVPTKRFWTSLQCRFGFSGNIFRYFDHAEVFNRVSARAPDDIIRYCIEKSDDGKERLLAVTNPNNACVQHNSLQDLLGRYGTERITYTDGIVRSTHRPRAGGNSFQILGDEFVNEFVIDTPIDGFGRPNIYLSLLRLICANGAIGYGKAFRAEIATGSKDEDVTFALMRAMDGFNNEEGYAAMRQRFENAGRSWASVHETQKLYRVLMGLVNSGGLKKTGREYVRTEDGGATEVETALPILHNFHKMTGDVSRTYGLANLDALSIKRQRTLPTACKVYDLLNFASEVASHHSQAHGAQRVQAYIGDLISNEYDLEGTVDQFSNWQDFFVGDEEAINTKAMLDRRLVG